MYLSFVVVVTSRYSEAKGGLKLKCIDVLLLFFWLGGGTRGRRFFFFF